MEGSGDRLAALWGVLALAVTALIVFFGTVPDAEAAPSKARFYEWQDDYGDDLILYVEATPSDPEPHHIVLIPDGRGYLITDSAGIVAPPACTQLDEASIRCATHQPAFFPTDVSWLWVTSGRGSDLIDLRLDRLDFTQVATGVGNDRVLTGTLSPLSSFFVEAGGGDDRLKGSVGRDGLNGETGNDVIRTGGGRRPRGGIRPGGPANNGDGGAGNDRVFGGRGKDWVLGGGGRDYVVGGRGRDEIDGGTGNDTINSRDGRRDGIACGPGNARRQHAIRDRHEGVIRVPSWARDLFSDTVNC